MTENAIVIKTESKNELAKKKKVKNLFEDNHKGSYEISCSFENAFEWLKLLKDTTGMQNHTSGMFVLERLNYALVKDGDPHSVTAVNDFACVMAELKPQNAAESMLVAQMITSFEMTQKCIAMSSAAGITFERQQIYFKSANQFMRTYVMQTEALNKMRNGGQQKIIVERVTVNEGGQAIVGNVTKTPGDRDEK